MGTRGLLGHTLRNGRKKGAYNHWDSYPSGLGVEIVKFIQSLSDEEIAKMAEMVEQLTWVNEPDPAPADAQIQYGQAGFADLTVSRQSSADWYCLLRHVQGAKALPHILNGSLKHLIDGTDFAADKLFCEWAYWIDWGKKELTVDWGDDSTTCHFGKLSIAWMEGVGRATEEEDEEESDTVEENEQKGLAGA